MGSISIVRASAGSGKTYLLAVEYIAAAMKYPTAFRSILAVTFTNKATAEMKRRILGELSSLAKGDQGGFFQSISQKTNYSATEIQRRAEITLNAILRDYSSFSVSTIDKFFQRIIRSFFRELGLDLHYKIEIDSSETLVEAINSVINSSHSDIALARKINRIVGEELDAGRRVDPHKALQNIAYSILSEQYTPSTIDDTEIQQAYDSLREEWKTACTELRQMANEACQIIENAGLSIEDFKSKNRGFATYFYRLRDSRRSVPAYNKTFSTTAQSCEETDYATKATIDRVRPILPQLMKQTARVMNRYDETLRLRSTFSVIDATYSRYMLLRHLSAEFYEILAARGQLSLSSTSRLIASIVEGADVPFIFERLGNRYSTIFIDEFQDTSIGQWDGFLPLLHEAISKCDERCVMLIGDIKQAIYRFRGGDWRLLGGGAEAQFTGSIEPSTPLNTSWRSDRQIVEFNNAVMRSVVDQATDLVDNFLLNSEKHQRESLGPILPNAYSDMQQLIPDGKVDGGYVELFNGGKDETLCWVVDRVQNIATRYPLSRAAILVRRKSEGDVIASALIGAGINIISDELLTIGSSRTARFIVDVFKYNTSSNPITLASINRFLGRDFTAELSEGEQNFIASLSSMTSIEGFESTIRFFELQTSDPFYLQSLYNLIYTHSKDNSTDIPTFVDKWDVSLCNHKVALPEVENAIRIMTIHKAKGLEFDAVIVPFFSWELFPSTRPATTIWCQAEIEPYDKFNPLPLTYTNELGESIYANQYFEQGVSSVVDNVNLIYVALTRAKSELYLGITDSPRANTAAELLGAATTKYFDGCNFKGEVPTANIKEEQQSSSTIYFDRIESFPPPPLAVDLLSPIIDEVD